MHAQIRRQLLSLGVPADKHNRESLLGMLPPDFPPEAVSQLDDTILGEVFIYLARKGAIKVPSRHICRFYIGREQLIAVAAAHLAGGLRRGERAVWILPEHLPQERAEAALRAVAGPWRPGAVLFAAERDWYKDFDQALTAWLKEEERALAEGFTGLCATGDAEFAGCSDEALAYEQRINSVIAGRHITALCTYPAAMASPAILKRLQAFHHDLIQL